MIPVCLPPPSPSPPPRNHLAFSPSYVEKRICWHANTAFISVHPLNFLNLSTALKTTVSFLTFPELLHIARGEKKKKKYQGNFTLFLCTQSQACGCLACSARGSLLPSQAEIKAGAEQVDKLGLRVEPFRYHMPPFFTPPLTKGLGKRHTLPLFLSLFYSPTPPISLLLILTGTQTQLKQQPPSLTLFCMPFEIVFPLPSRTAV